jgi:hypothetical protein
MGMTKVRIALPLLVLGGWVVGAGCDDDRGAVDLGAGGDVAQPGGAAGNAGASGDETMPGGAGGSAASGAAAGVGGATAGEGGAGECPANIFTADGKACAAEGTTCSDGGDDPCQFGQSIVCQSGKWSRQEAFPAPCGGAGGQGSGGAGGAGGAP